MSGHHPPRAHELTAAQTVHLDEIVSEWNARREALGAQGIAVIPASREEVIETLLAHETARLHWSKRK